MENHELSKIDVHSVWYDNEYVSSFQCSS